MGIVGCMSIRVMGLRSRAGLGEIGAHRDEVDVLVAGNVLVRASPVWLFQYLRRQYTAN